MPTGPSTSKAAGKEQKRKEQEKRKNHYKVDKRNLNESEHNKEHEHKREHEPECERFDTCVADHIIKNVINDIIGDAEYRPSLAKLWATQIVDKSIEVLTAGDNQSHKYIVNSVIIEKDKAHLHLASGCFWDSASDGSCTVRWENATMHCIVSVYGLMHIRDY